VAMRVVRDACTEVGETIDGGLPSMARAFHIVTVSRSHHESGGPVSRRAGTRQEIFVHTRPVRRRALRIGTTWLALGKGPFVTGCGIAKGEAPLPVIPILATPSWNRNATGIAKGLLCPSPLR